MNQAPEQRLQPRAVLRILCIFSVFFCMLSAGLYAQTNAPPDLHRRNGTSGVEEEEDTAAVSRGRTTLPLEASGEYLLGGRGDAIEIDLEPRRLSGYISRRGDQISDQGTPLTYFFATGILNGQELSFTTHQVHGVWFSFTGTIVRGKPKSRSEEGYYRLEGALVMHDSASTPEQPRRVSLPLAQQYAGH